MDERTILDSLKRMILQILINADENSFPEEITELISGTCWDGLIIFLRELISSKKEVCFDGLGSFIFVGDKYWYFHPAISLVENEALNLDRKEGYEHFASRGFALIDQGISILNQIPDDILLGDIEILESSRKIDVYEFFISKKFVSQKLKEVEHFVQKFNERIFKKRKVSKNELFLTSNLGEPRYLIEADENDAEQEE